MFRMSPWRNAPQRVAQYAHRALFEYDVLMMIFDMLDLQDKRDQQTCAHSALVCRAWTEPASRVLWSSRVRWGNRGEWWLGDLCRIILHDEPDSRIRSVNAYVRAWIKWKCSALRRNGAQRQSMLRCGPRIRRLHVDQTFFMRLLSRDDLMLLRRVLCVSGGRTFLPALLSLYWIEEPVTKGLLLRLIPSSLEDLRLYLHWETSPKQVQRLFVELSRSAPSLRRMRIYVSRRELLQLEALLNISSMRELLLEGHIDVDPTELIKILSTIPLVSFKADLRDFTTLTERIDTGSLKDLDVVGTYTDLTALLTHLRAPNLVDLSLKTVQVVDAHFEPRSAAVRRLSRVLLKFVGSLRSLRLHYTVPDSEYRSTKVQRTSPMGQVVPDVLAPLLGLDLERFMLRSEVPEVVVTNEMILHMAQSWPMIRSLSFTTALYKQNARRAATPAALVHLARYCPKLEFVCMHSLDTVAFDPPPSEPLRALNFNHPLRTLQVSCSAYSARCLGDREAWRTAEFLDSPFPNLTVEAPNNGFPDNWCRVWKALQSIQADRRAGREPRLSTFMLNLH